MWVTIPADGLKRLRQFDQCLRLLTQSSLLFMQLRGLQSDPARLERTSLSDKPLSRAGGVQQQRGKQLLRPIERL